MSAGYQAVLWNRQKKRYDLTILAGILLYVGLFIGLGSVLRPQATAETLIIRAFGTLALLMLHVILSIGPLARLDKRFLPLLYNRRHLGVSMFLCALVHGAFSLIQFHSLGEVNPLVSLLAGNPQYASISAFPFQTLGFVALGILFLMAATSHDFWLANLSAPVWKALHMLVYVAYLLLVLHVALGILQSERNLVLIGLLVGGFGWIVTLHLVAGFREKPGDDAHRGDLIDGYLHACAVADIKDKRARIVCIAGERVAIFRNGDGISAVSNACQHQNGPLGEGRIVDGCITCPWHGYQYEPETGASPPPFTEKIPTFNVRVVSGEVYVDPEPNPAGQRAEPAPIRGS